MEMWIHLKFETPEELQAKVEKYFNGWCRAKKQVIKQWKDYVEIEIPTPTITGLALYLWFESRQSFYDYEKRKAFSYTIKRARTFIEMEYEEMLRTNPTGAIFALKNFDWKDKTEVDSRNLNIDTSLEEIENMESNKIEELRKKIIW